MHALGIWSSTSAASSLLPRSFHLLSLSRLAHPPSHSTPPSLSPSPSPSPSPQVRNSAPSVPATSSLPLLTHESHQFPSLSRRPSSASAAAESAACEHGRATAGLWQEQQSQSSSSRSSTGSSSSSSSSCGSSLNPKPLHPHLLPPSSAWRPFHSSSPWTSDGAVAREHKEDRIIGYSPEQLFDIVSAVERYDEFVPWCVRSRVVRREQGSLEAELEIGFQMFTEKYTSHVTLQRPGLIRTRVAESALFAHLNNDWRFHPGPTPHSCHLFFSVDFEFRSPLYRQVANLFFNEVVAYMVNSFEKRCEQVYGPSMARVHRV